jgi:phage head maturation protease
LDELRIKEADEEKGAEIIGHAAVFDSWSETLGGIFPFKEKVRRGAFAESILKDE